MSIRYKYPEKDPFYDKPMEQRVNYFEQDTLAKDWLNNLIKNIGKNLFERQHDFCYFAGELGKGKNPKLKDNAIEYINTVCEKEMFYLREAIITYFLRECLHDDIDLNDEAIDWLLDEGFSNELTDFNQLIPKWLKEK